MIASHPPEVLRDLAERLRRAPAPPWVPGVAGGEVHMLERDELAAAHAAGVLELDRECSARLLGEAPRT